MPFHIHGSQMNGFPLPSSSHLSLLLCFPFFFSPIFTLFRPASLNYCHAQAPTSGKALPVDWAVGWERREGGRDVYCIWMWWEEETVCDIPVHGLCLQVCLYVCGHAWLFPCLWVCLICPWANCLPHTMSVVAMALWQQQFDICEG